MSLTVAEVQQRDLGLPGGWTRTKFGEIYELVYGKSLTKAARNTDGAYPVYGSSGIVDYHDAFLVEGPAIVVGRKGAAGAVTFSRGPCWPIDTTYYVRDCEHIDIRYSYYFLTSLRLGQFDRSTAIPGLNRDDAYDLAVNLPPLSEQRRIVAKIEELFSEMDKGIGNLEKAREQLRVYRQAVLKHAFEGKLTTQWRADNKDKLQSPEQLLARVKKTRSAHHDQKLKEWEEAVRTWELKAGQTRKRPSKPRSFTQPREITPGEMQSLPSLPKNWRLVRLCEIAQIGSGMSVSATRVLEDPIEVAYLRVANVQRGFLDLSEIKFMRIEGSQLPNLQLKRWDVLFNEGGDRDKLGRGWVWQSEISPCITQNHVFRASPYRTSESNSKLLSHWGNTFGQGYFEKTGKQTTNLASINKTVLSEFPVPLIPLEEQDEICKRLERTMTILGTQDEAISVALKQAGLLRQSILQKAFSGQLVAQDPNDEPASALLERIKAQKLAQSHSAKRRNKRRRARATA